MSQGIPNKANESYRVEEGIHCSELGMRTKDKRMSRR